ncbi:MAG TPA: STAS/SEC14 domain-containing protein [Gemmatimonadota bacterium]|nr:STAS/SEC14 domain-containing protein [Gemmatimonadota bacterium]
MPIVELMEESSGPVLVLHVRSGREGGADPADVAARARETVRRHGSLRLLLLVEKIGLLEAASLRSHLPLAAGLAADVERVAIVGDQGWLEGAVRSAPATGRAQVRVFPHSRVEDAREWVHGRGEST